ncbi:ADP-ribosylglycohydrolase family protein [Labilibaculum antarcticum]|uniref:ADP-ribosylglycohydrolase n=1 Tax=Labilibaculum antarcticum TaxID=1717717 RepID=A0A1Y1CPJ6_9BACT|nr:ADP-ribosylglycohydrolase family protein [Labilibaculum antarcticum]BAX82347.1 hypothetical protein ALGA_4056 [Labilibaculum antarcticum]
MVKQSNSRDILIGLSVGDALGVPIEFLSRADLDADPVTGMKEYGIHNQPAGTWSDDSSMAFCLAESLLNGYNLKDIAQKFIAWFDEAWWTSHGVVFDYGITTSEAIARLKSKTLPPEQAGGINEGDNGNGALMRILPLVLYTMDLPLQERFERVKEVASMTHGHIRSTLCCFFYTELAIGIGYGKSFNEAVKLASQIVSKMIKSNLAWEGEGQHFKRIFDAKIGNLSREEISSSGYVIHILEATLWCLYNSNSYEEAVLLAVNLGDDTDTTAAVVGGLAGLLYGYKSIPNKWMMQLVRKDDILNLADALENRISSSVSPDL